MHEGVPQVGAALGAVHVQPQLAAFATPQTPRGRFLNPYHAPSLSFSPVGALAPSALEAAQICALPARTWVARWRLRGIHVSREESGWRAPARALV